MRFQNICYKLLNSAIETTADALKYISDTACFLGGLGLRVSWELDEKASIAYFGMEETLGYVEMKMDVEQFNLGYNHSIPIYHYGQTAGGSSYNLQDYVDPGLLRIISLVCITGGTFMRLGGAVLKRYQLSREDIKYYKEHEGIKIDGPSKEEYKNLMIGSFFDSMFQTSLGSLVGSIIVYSGALNPNHCITYPSEGEHSGQNSTYDGPLESKQYPLSKTFEDKETVNFPGLPMPVEVKTNVKVDALVNVKYGAELSFKSNEEHSSPLEIAGLAPLTLSVYRLGTFFNQKADRQREQRLLDGIKSDRLILNV